MHGPLGTRIWSLLRPTLFAEGFNAEPRNLEEWKKRVFGLGDDGYWLVRVFHVRWNVDWNLAHQLSSYQPHDSYIVNTSIPFQHRMVLV